MRSGNSLVRDIKAVHGCWAQFCPILSTITQIWSEVKNIGLDNSSRKYVRDLSILSGMIFKNIYIYRLEFVSK